MRYFELALDAGGTAYQEVFDGRVLRFTDEDGNTVDVVGGSSVVGEVFPAWGLPDPVPEPQPEPEPVLRRLTKLQFIQRFTDVEFATILGATKVNIALEAWYEQFRLATPEPDGTSIDLDDPRTQGGVMALEAGGLLALGRAAEILG